MNLHEECLLKYLLNPMELFNSTEKLVLTNKLIESKIKKLEAGLNKVSIQNANT